MVCHTGVRYDRRTAIYTVDPGHLDYCLLFSEEARTDFLSELVNIGYSVSAYRRPSCVQRYSFSVLRLKDKQLKVNLALFISSAINIYVLYTGIPPKHVYNSHILMSLLTPSPRDRMVSYLKNQ